MIIRLKWIERVCMPIFRTECGWGGCEGKEITSNCDNYAYSVCNTWYEGKRKKSFPPHLSGQGVKVRLLSRATNSPHGLTSLPLKKQVLKTTVMLVTSSLLPSYFKLVLYYWHKPYYCRMISSPPRALCRAIPINFFLGSWPVSHTWVAVSILWSSTGKVTNTYFQMGLFILQHL